MSSENSISNSKWPVIAGITRMTTIDYPEMLSTVFYTQGCQWRCQYCHNPELLSTRLTDPSSSKSLPWEQLMDYLDSRKGLLDAVVFSGGEPLIQPGLDKAMKLIKEKGFKIGIHTSGVLPQKTSLILPYLDWVGLDVKCMPENYGKITQRKKGLDAVWDVLEQLLAADVILECRTTVFWSLTPVNEILELAKLLASKGVKKYILQIGRAGNCLTKKLNKLENLPPEELPELLLELDKLFDEFVVRDN